MVTADLVIRTESCTNHGADSPVRSVGDNADQFNHGRYYSCRSSSLRIWHPPTVSPWLGLSSLVGSARLDGSRFTISSFAHLHDSFSVSKMSGHRLFGAYPTATLLFFARDVVLARPFDHPLASSCSPRETCLALTQATSWGDCPDSHRHRLSPLVHHRHLLRSMTRKGNATEVKAPVYR